MAARQVERVISPEILPSREVRVDPSAPGTIIRWAFGIEAAANIVGAVGMLLYPSSLLSMAVARPVLDVNATSVSLMQWMGGLVLGLTPQLVLGMANTRSAIESRPTIYWTLFSGEAFLLPIFFWQASVAGSSGLTPTALAVCASTLVGPCLWRLYVLFVRPDWLGRWLDERDTKAQ